MTALVILGVVIVGAAVYAICRGGKEEPAAVSAPEGATKYCIRGVGHDGPCNGIPRSDCPIYTPPVKKAPVFARVKKKFKFGRGKNPASHKRGW
jgi:hypothetical protein